MKSVVAAASRLFAGSPSRSGSRVARPLPTLLTRLFAVMVAAATVVALGPTAAFAATGDWAQFRETQTHQAHNTAETFLSDTNVHALGVAWTGATGASVNSSPAVANGVVYVGSTDTKLYAFAVGCGTAGAACTPIWKGATGGAIDSSPAAAGTHVFVGSSNGKLYAFKIGCGTGGATCAPVWTSTTVGAIHSSPSVDGSVVYVGSDDGNLYAFDEAGVIGCTGLPKVCSPIWQGTTGGPVQSSPAVASGVVYVGSNDTKLYAFAAGCSTGGGTCLPLWTAATGGAIHSSPTILSGVAYVGSLDHKLYAFDATAATGCSGSPVICTPMWTATTGGPIYASPSIGDGHVWIGSDDGKVYSYHASCGTGNAICQPLWTGATGGAVRSSPASVHDVLYVGSADGKLYAFDADCATNGSACLPAYSHAIGTSVQSSPAISNSVVYVGSNDGKLYAFHLVPNHLVLAPAGPTVVAGATQAFTAEAFDSLNVDLGDVTASTRFAISGTGSCAANVCGSAVAGDHTITGTDGPATGSTVLHVSSAGANHLVLTPAGASILVGATQTYKAEGFDSLNHDVGNLTSVTRFTISGAGTCTANACGSNIGGDYTVTGKVGAATGTTVLHVLAPNHLILSPAGATIVAGATQAFAAEGFDSHNVDLGSFTPRTTFTISAPGTCAANACGATTGGTYTVTGKFGAVTGTTTLHVSKAGATFFALTPARLLDTRSGNGLNGTFRSQVARTFKVAGRGGVPANAVAVTGNLTVTSQTAKGYLFIGPNPINAPTSSTLNFPVNDNRANAVTRKLVAPLTL